MLYIKAKEDNEFYEGVIFMFFLRYMVVTGLLFLP